MARGFEPMSAGKQGRSGEAASGKQVSWTLAQVIQAYEQGGPRDSHHGGARLIRKNATPSFLGTSIEAVSHEMFELELRAYLGGGDRRRDTGYRFVVDFNRLMQWAMEEGYRVSPFRAYPVPDSARSAPEPLSLDEVGRLLAVLDGEYCEDLRWRIIVRALVLLGLEIEEARDFSFSKTREIKGCYVISDRKGRLRHIPIPKDMQVLIARAQHAGDPSGAPLESLRVSANALMKSVRRLGELAGIPGLTPHRLQQTAIYGE